MCEGSCVLCEGSCVCVCVMCEGEGECVKMLRCDDLNLIDTIQIRFGVKVYNLGANNATLQGGKQSLRGV